MQPFCWCKFEYVKTQEKLLRCCSHSFQLFTFRNMQLQSNQKFRQKKKKKRDHKAQTNLGFGLASSECVRYAEINPYFTVHERISKTFFQKITNGVSCLVELRTCIPARICGLRSVSLLPRAILLPLLYSEWKQMQSLFF